VHPEWRPCQEPLGTTLLRAGAIAAAVGLVASIVAGRGVWIVATIWAFWFAFGGHWVELFFLNWLRFRLSPARAVQVAARLVVWFVGGILLWAGLAVTTALMAGHPMRWAVPWPAGVGFIALELVVHLVLQVRGAANVYDERG
jgi:hypothetical protein